MKTWLTFAILCLAGAVLVVEPNFAQQAAQEKKSVLRHVVVFKFKPEATPEQIREIEQAFAALPSKIPAIADFEWGTNNSPEGLDQGFTHCFLVTFHDEKGRDKYLPHPAHQEFVQKLRPILDQAFVIDYWTKS